MLDRENHPACHAAAEVGWRVVEGTASDEEVAAVRELLRVAWEESCEAAYQFFEAPPEAWVLPRFINVLTLLFTEPDGAAFELVVSRAIFSQGPPIPLLTPAETLGCCDLLREVFGNRGELSTHGGWEPKWRTSSVVAIARQMYESQDFDAMPILADALQDAGCERADILRHCRKPRSHIRGCWVVDFVLGKA